MLVLHPKKKLVGVAHKFGALGLALSSAKIAKVGYFIRILGFFRYKDACVSGVPDVIHAI